MKTSIETSLAQLIDNLAEDRAAKIRAVSRAAVIMTIVPEWMRAEEVKAYFGLPPNQLHRLVVQRKVVAKKLDPTLRSSAVIYRVADIRTAIEGCEDYATWLASQREDETQTKGENNE